MEVRPHKEDGTDEQWEFDIAYTLDETDVLKAAYREKLYRLAKSDRINAISPFYTQVANWPEKECLVVNTNSIIDQVNILKEFSENTTIAMVEIPERPGAPAFKNPYLAERRIVGLRAAELASQLCTEVDSYYSCLFQQELAGQDGVPAGW